MIDIARANVDYFESNCDYDKFTQSAINRIEKDIIRYSKKGINHIEYYNEEFHIHTNMEKVKEHFTTQGFNIKRWFVYVTTNIFSEPYIWLDAKIEWTTKDK